MNTKDQLNFFLIKQFHLCNPLADSYFIFCQNIASCLLKKKYHRACHLNKCWMDIYQAVNFMWKWARPKRDLFLSLCTISRIVMYAIFKIKPIVSECSCIFTMFIQHIYSALVNIYITSKALSIGAERQTFCS